MFGPRTLIIPILLTAKASTFILPNFGVSRPSLDSCLVQSVTQLSVLRAHETTIGYVVVVAIWQGVTVTRVFTSDCSPTNKAVSWPERAQTTSSLPSFAPLPTFHGRLARALTL